MKPIVADDVLKAEIEKLKAENERLKAEKLRDETIKRLKVELVESQARIDELLIQLKHKI